MEITEDLLDEITNSLRNDIDKKCHSIARTDSYVPRIVRFTIVVAMKGAIVSFSMWPYMTSGFDRNDVFNLVKNYFEKEYGIKLTNQRLHSCQVRMEFGENSNPIDPLELYTLMKIKQIV